MIVIGVDPDSDKHGVAIYNNGKLTGLYMWTLTDFMDQLEGATHTIISMENVLINKPTFPKKGADSRAMISKVSQNVGQCKQAQRELMRLFDYLDVPYQLVSPMRGNWAKNKAQFERVTGWTGSSNADTRSAAFFGYLAIK